MEFELSPRCQELRGQLLAFMNENVYPREHEYHAEVEANRAKGNPWIPTKVVEELKTKARAAGLWNLFLPKSERAPNGGLSNLDYAPLCEIMGRVGWSGEIFNCSAPDTGNMETIERYGTEAHKRQWLDPLLRGEIRSAFAMTEPAVASSDATNIQTSIERVGNEYVINGTKWWTSGAGDPRCAIFITMGKTDPNAARHSQQSMVLVPRNTPGVTIKRPLTVYGYDDAPHGHCEVEFKDVRIPVDSILLGEGRGFEIAQGRLGPGRIHHCMRSVGVAERGLEYMCRRLTERVAFGKRISEYNVWHERIAEARIGIDTSRLLTMKAAYMMDTVGNKIARTEIAMIKVLVPNHTEKVLDWAIQAHGAGGVSGDFPLAKMWAGNRTLRLADGPDEVHRNAIAKLEIGKHTPIPKGAGSTEVEMPITRS